VVSSTSRPHFTPGKDTIPILQEAGWAPGPVWTGGQFRPHRDSIPDRPARNQSLYRLSYPAHRYVYVYTHTDTGRAKEINKKIGIVNAACQRNISLVILGTRAIGSTALTYAIPVLIEAESFLMRKHYKYISSPNRKRECATSLVFIAIFALLGCCTASVGSY